MSVPRKNRYCSHFFITGFLPLRTFYTHQMDVFHRDIQPNADQGQDVRLKGILITSLFQLLQNNPCTYALHHLHPLV